MKVLITLLAMTALAPPALAQAMPTQANVGTGHRFSASDGIWGPCERSTWLITASTTCNMQRLFEQVPDCSGRPLPPA